jgi:hypothetical protein
MTIQRWLIFPADISKSTILWYLDNNKDVSGYMTGVPANLQALADEEGWTLPHIYEEEISDAG